MSIFFISDLHLEQNKPHLTKAFENFIDSKVNLHDMPCPYLKLVNLDFDLLYRPH